MRNIEQLREHLQEANLKIHQVEIERDRALDRIKNLQKQITQQDNVRGSQESLRSVNSRDGSSASGCLSKGVKPEGNKSNTLVKFPSNIVAPLTSIRDLECKVASLPRNIKMDAVEQTAPSRQTSINSLPSEIGT